MQNFVYSSTSNEKQRKISDRKIRRGHGIESQIDIPVYFEKREENPNHAIFLD
jgi:hypothetical protein